MRLSLRWHIYFTIFPLLLLLLILGGAGAWLLHQLGRSINLSIRENADSIIYMNDLQTALGDVDAALRSALTGHEQQAKEQFDKNWDRFKKNLDNEDGNITVEGEAKLVAQLKELTDRYKKRARLLLQPPGREQGSAARLRRGRQARSWRSARSAPANR